MFENTDCLRKVSYLTLAVCLILLTINFVYAEDPIPNSLNISVISNISFYQADIFGGQLFSPRPYLFEGEEIKFEALVYSETGVSNLDKVYIYVKDNLEAECTLDKIVDDFDQTYYCRLTIETSSMMYGQSLIRAEIRTLDGAQSSVDIGSFFLNPSVRIYSSVESLYFESVPGGNIVYSDWINITNSGDNIPLNLTISATNFYDSTHIWGVRCPSSNELNFNNLYYYAENGNYSTKQDFRADSEGYLRIPEGIDIFSSKELILGHSILINEPVKLKFRLNIPLPCNGNFDTGGVYIWANAGDSGLPISLFLNLHENVAQNLTLKLISNVTLYHSNLSCFYGKCGPLTSIRNYTDSEYLEYSEGYLFEGEIIEADVQVYSSFKIEAVSDVGITVGASPGPGNDWMDEFYILPEYPPEDWIPPYTCRRVAGNYNPSTTSNYHCSWPIFKPEWVNGIYYVQIEARDSTGNQVYVPLGLWYLNPTLALRTDNSIKFNETVQGTRSYSEPIRIYNNGAAGSNVSLNMFITEINNLGTNQSNLYYYAENDNYTTKDDPRADSEGFIEINYGNEIPRNSSGEIIKPLNHSSLDYEGNILQKEGAIELIFRMDIPNSWNSGDSKSGAVYLLADSADGVSPQSPSLFLPYNLNITKSKLMGDFNNDGTVNYGDVSIFIESFGKNEGEKGFSSICDLNGDVSVDVVDLLYLVGNLGKHI